MRFLLLFLLLLPAASIAADLYTEGVIKAEAEKPAFPDILTFYAVTTPIEQTFHVMFRVPSKALSI